MPRTTTLNQILSSPIERNFDEDTSKSNVKRLESARELIARIWQDSHTIAKLLSDIHRSLTPNSLNKNEITSLIIRIDSSTEEIIKQINLLRQHVG